MNENVTMEYDMIMLQFDQADKKFGDEDYKGAKKLYEDALKILPNEIHPRDQIKECERRMKDAADALAEQERIDKEYNEFRQVSNRGRERAGKFVLVYGKQLKVGPFVHVIGYGTNEWILLNLKERCVAPR